ncbi:hypothetical protein FQN49_003024 [Arthroderma sp. PD_2]|nr:hypothetical protein FQN49_003024 [Arthroderma sp. PD_2]
MASKSRDDIARQYENYSIYVILSTRGANPGFHWGIFVPTDTPTGQVWHATNREGGWKLEQRPSSNVPFSMSLVLAYKIGSVNDSNWQTCKDVLSGVAAGPHPSPNTGEAFSCRVWAKDAIIALRDNGIIVLEEDLSSIEALLLSRASQHKSSVETGASTAKVVNSYS